MRLLLFSGLFAFGVLATQCSDTRFLSQTVPASESRIPKRQLGIGTPVLTKLQNPDGTWGVQIDNIGKAAVFNKYPIRIDTYFFGTPTVRTAGYTTVTNIAGGLEATGTLNPGFSGVTFTVTDTWKPANNSVQFQRTLKVNGNDGLQRFMSALVMDSFTAAPRTGVDYFAPGIIYGSYANLKPDTIGGSNTYTAAGYSGVVRIREDRLAAPMLGIRFDDSTSVTLINPAPDATTIKADGDDTDGNEVVDSRMRFGALGAEQTNASASPIKLGYWFPGSEGEVTYNTKGDDVGQKRWRLRLHPVSDGLTQKYAITLQFASGENYLTYTRNAWRKAWDLLETSSKVNRYDMDLVRRTLTDFIYAHTIQDNGVTSFPPEQTVAGGRTGITNLWDVVTNKEIAWFQRVAFLGFIGRNLENAEYLLREAVIRAGTADEAKFRATAYNIIKTQLLKPVNPPVSEGVKLNDGSNIFYPNSNEVFTRPFTEDMNALLRAYQFEAARGRTNAAWVGWVKAYADWLLPKQGADGSFPRSFNAGSGTVKDPSTFASYLPVQMLLRLGTVTGNQSYRTAALRAAEFAWKTIQNSGYHFVGGTDDRPDVITKESAGIAAETFMALYQTTNDSVWLERARMAADNNETWIYAWNMPMPADVPEASLSIKPGTSTVGMSLVASSLSSVDMYSANDVDTFAKLYSFTGDSHYLDVARILMHNTKNTIALPGRTFDLGALGMSQEFWNLAVDRGRSALREFSAWQTAAQLHGIVQTREFSPSVYDQIAR